MGKVFRLTESDLTRIIKRVLNEQKPDSMMPWQIEKFGYKQNDPKTLKPALQQQQKAIQSIVDYCKSHKEICYSVGEIGLWFIPFIGPYLSASLGMVQAIDYIKNGNKTLGIIYLLLSPLMLIKTIKMLKLLSPELKIIKPLETINKSGLPIFLNQGEQAFFSWLEKNFGKEFKDVFIKVINSPQTNVEFKNVSNTKIKPEIVKWIKNNPEQYKKLSLNDKNKINSFLKK